MRVRYSYLPQQFADVGTLWDDLRRLVESGDFTLGAPVTELETRFADLIGTRHAIGVGSGTDALKLSLKAAGVGYGDEVITAANTFIATAGAIAEIGATPVFIDCTDTFCMDVDQLEAAITPKTKAIMPVHYTGYVADMPRIMTVAETHGLVVIEDACQAILATMNGRKAGTWGLAAGFSLHPLKNLNVWGDAGIIVTDDDDMAATLRLLRNHGMVSRDEIAAISERHGLRVIEDAAQSMGSKLPGRMAGTFGDVGCFSAHPLKNLNAMGDAGYALTDDAEIAARMRRLRNNGLADRDTVVEWGFVDRMDSLQAAVLTRRLELLDGIIERRRANVARYRERLDPAHVYWPPCRNDEFNTFHTFVVQVDRRDDLRAHLADHGIGSAIHYPVPIHLQPAAAALGHTAGAFPVAERQAGRIVSLPVHQFLEPEDIRHVADTVNGFYG